MSNNWALNSNDLGQVVGFSDVTRDTTNHAFLWQDGLMTDLGTLSGDFSSFAPAINNIGQVVGASCDQNGNCRAFLWQNGNMTDLNTLIPADSPLYLLQALDINSFGQIVGCAFQFSSGEVHAFLLTPASGTGNTGPKLAVPGQGVKISLPDDVRKRLQDSLIPGRARFKVSVTPTN
jgi:probable HAF family extracellular repeat protein